MLCFAALFAVALAEYGHEHGQAYSSQQVSRHDGHPEIVHQHGGHDHSHDHEYFDYHVSYYLIFDMLIF